MKCIQDISDPEVYWDNAFINSEFIEIKSNDYFDVQMKYPILKMKNAESKCLVRREVYCLLLKAVKGLPSGYKFRIWDAWRPFALQQELYETYSASILKTFKLEDASDEQKKNFIKQFVSEPNMDEELPPVHTTGGAIDITLLNPKGSELDMGTEFDDFTDKTHTAYFEKLNNSISVRDNRRLLYNIMTSVGFTNLPSEWWHFDYGDRFWAYYNKKPAIYRGVFERNSINVRE
jgi:D-alanyl-D-alanine dipeptidase